MNDYTPEEEEAWKQVERQATPAAPPKTRPILTHNYIEFGDYMIWDIDDQTFGISYAGGETGVFSKEEFRAHVAAFFGVNWANF